MSVTEEERAEMFRQLQLEGKSKKYGYLTAYPFTVAILGWAIIDKNSPDAAIYPILLVAAMVNMLPMVLFQVIYRKYVFK
jgi:hypothetical protein